MAKENPGRKFSFAIYDRKHMKNLLRRAKEISDIFNDAAREGARIGETTGYTDPDGEFTFDKFPAAKQRAEELFKELHDQLLLIVTAGNREEWMLSAAKNDAMVQEVIGLIEKHGKLAEAWHEPHLEALEQFNKRKERGMDLSDRVWRLTDQFKGELELALEMGLGDGKSAASLSRDVRECLQEPHKLFRRVRNKKGQLRLSKAAAAYHPGQGVYRSSYKNALRLTATENNIAYRTADHERWNDLDFVIGIEIKLSGNHPVKDICDEMCGVYPKTFKFVGWHPFCRCIAIPKLADEDEFIRRQQALIDGEDVPQGGYSGEVKEMPQCFTDWVKKNAKRIETAKNQPYFIRDNRAEVDKALERESSGYGADKSGKKGKKGKITDPYAHTNPKPPVLTEEQKRNVSEIASLLGIDEQDIRPMNFYEADNGKGNCNFGQNKIYEENCFMAIIAHELRLRGLDVTALGFDVKNELMKELHKEYEKAWINPGTKREVKAKVIGDAKWQEKIKAAKKHRRKLPDWPYTDEELIAGMEEKMASPGRYHIGINYLDDDDGHVIVAEKLSNGNIIYYDPQWNEFKPIGGCHGLQYLEVIRVDNLLINAKKASKLVRQIK